MAPFSRDVHDILITFPTTLRTLSASMLAVVVAACASAAPARTGSTASATRDGSHYSYTAADVHFMSGMISHHAQAIMMSNMAPTRGASQRVQTLAARIINAQQDEIASMQSWLRDHNQPVPAADDHSTMDMPGMDMSTLMPGMLTASQMSQLDKARGEEFDRLFLTFMIQHHRGAITMVDTLFDTQGAAQDETVFKLASDVRVDQETEIARMQQMIAALRSP